MRPTAPSPTATLDFYRAAQGRLPGATSALANNPSSGFALFLGRVFSGIMAVAAFTLLIYMLWGAIEWLTSGGDSGKVQKARDKMTQGVIGMVVLASTVAIFNLVQRFLGINILTFR
jgi:hypothetical protein